MVAGWARLRTAWTTHPSRSFLRSDRGTLSYVELERRASAYAGWLAQEGLRAGDRVAVFADTDPDVIVALFGHHRLGVIHVPINTRYQHEEVNHILSDAQPRLVLTDAAHRAVVERAMTDRLAVKLIGQPAPLGAGPGPTAPAADHPDDAPALMIYTSGTTAKSKGVILPFRSIVGNVSALTDLWGWSSSDRLVLALPLFHVHGLGIGVYGSVLHGMSIDLLPSFDPARVVTAIAEGATVFMGVPTMYRRLVHHLDGDPPAANALRAARLFTSGSAALSPDLFTRFETLTGHQIVERYGMSETLFTLSNRLEERRRPGVVGRPVPGVEARIVDEDGRVVAPTEVGELEVRGGGMMTEYWGKPEETSASFAAGGWFKTGDVVRQDDRGDFQIVGRKSVDIIKSGGFKISAREIEDVLRDHDRVEDVAVVGIPDPEWGQAIVAVAVPVGEPIDADTLPEELVALAAARLAGYKKPRRVVLTKALPRNALGKIQKHVLIASLTAQP